MASGQDTKIRFTAVGMTDVGRVREHNEDNFLAVDLGTDKRASSGQAFSGPLLQRGLSLVVADGMGGAAAGEVASQMAVDTLHEAFKAADLGGTVRVEPDVIGLLETAINRANESIFRKGQESKEHQGMGTTLTASVVLGDSLYLSQVGDSRGYILRKGKLVQMTRDQSLIGQLIEEGTLTEEQAEKLGGKNIILQALGVEESLKIDSKRYEILRDDVLLLCSDGLTGMVTDEEIEQILVGEPDLGKAVRKLIDAANEGGGKDNITCILARFEGEGLREPLTPLTDADKAGGSFHAPPPPKSKAGRNAVAAAAAVLAVVGVVLFWPKPVLLRVASNVEASVLLREEGAGDADPGMEGTTKPGSAAEFELPRKRTFLATVSAPGYVERTEKVNTAVDQAVISESWPLTRKPATSLDFVPPPYKGRTLGGIRVQLVALDGQKAPDLPVAVKDSPEPEFPTGFPAGRWKGKVSRPGFAPVETEEFDVPSEKPFSVRLPVLEERFGTLVIEKAPVGASVLLLDGEEELLDEPARVLATKSSPPLKVRATEVTVRVTKEGYEPYSSRVVVEADREDSVSLEEHKAAVSLKAAPNSRIRIVPVDRPGAGAESVTVGASGVTQRVFLPSGTYRVSLRPPGSIDEETRTLVLEAGQQVIDRDFSALPK